MDFEDDVRSAAIEAITAAAIHSLSLLGSLQPLKTVSLAFSLEVPLAAAMTQVLGSHACGQTSTA